jgi:hypothetical protein
VYRIFLKYKWLCFQKEIRTDQAFCKLIKYINKTVCTPGLTYRIVHLYCFTTLLLHYFCTKLRNICVTNDNGNIPFIVSTSGSFARSWLITEFVTRVIRRVPLVGQELLILPEFILNTMTNRKRDNTMTNRKRDNTMTNRKRENTMTNRKRDNTMTNRSFFLVIVLSLFLLVIVLSLFLLVIVLSLFLLVIVLSLNRKRENTMTKRKRDNTMTKRKRDNTMTKRNRTNNDLQNTTQ